MGACIGLQFAVAHPEKVLSLSMVSPLPLHEVRYGSMDFS